MSSSKRSSHPRAAIAGIGISMAVIVFGMSVLHFVSYDGLWRFRRHEKRVLLQSSDGVHKNKSQLPSGPLRGVPVRIVISDANIDLPVVDGTYDAGSQTWSLSSDKAHFATPTALANAKEGSTFIYGHNSKSVFAGLSKLQPGSIAVVETENGLKFRYILRTYKDVEPTDTSILSYRGKPILTVQTCAGTWFEDRRLYTFDFESVETAS